MEAREVGRRSLRETKGEELPSSFCFCAEAGLEGDTESGRVGWIEVRRSEGFGVGKGDRDEERCLRRGKGERMWHFNKFFWYEIRVYGV